MNVLGEWSHRLAPLADAPVLAVVLLKATVLLAVAWLIHLALARANPRWRVLLWRGTALALAALPVLEFVPSAIELSVRRPEVASAGALPPAVPIAWQSGTSMPPRAESPPPSVTEGDPRKAEGVSATGQAEPLVATRALETLGRWTLPAIWLGGFVLLAARLGIGFSRIRRWVRSCQPAPDWVIQQCRQVAETLEYRRVMPVRRCETISTPLLCGLRRPLLVLPERMCQDAYRHELPGSWPTSWPTPGKPIVCGTHGCTWFRYRFGSIRCAGGCGVHTRRRPTRRATRLRQGCSATRRPTVGCSPGWHSTCPRRLRRWALPWPVCRTSRAGSAR